MYMHNYNDNFIHYSMINYIRLYVYLGRIVHKKKTDDSDKHISMY